MSGHVRTWYRWLEHLTIIGLSERFTEQDRMAMAEALGMAAPEGPEGIPCLDGCAQHPHDHAKRAATLLAELIDRGVEIENIERTLDQLRDAISEDVRRITRPGDFRPLADTGVIVSIRGSDVVRARRAYPRTWEVIERILR